MADYESLPLRDFIYLDVERVASIYSQLEGGLVTGVEASAEDASEGHGALHLNLALVAPEVGGAKTQRTALSESRIPHHDLFRAVEDALFERGYAMDVAQAFTSDDVRSGEAHRRLTNAFYVRAEGWCTLDDYSRMKHMSGRFNQLAAFLRRCQLSSLEDDPAVAEARRAVEAARQEAAGEPDNARRLKAERRVAKMDSALDAVLQQVTGTSDVEDWLIHGIGDFIDTFLAERIVLTVYPFDDVLPFHVTANLRPDCFANSDIGNLMFAYGAKPNVRLTVFGLLTSLPPAGGPPFDPMAAYEDETFVSEEQSGVRAIEKAFRAMFANFDELDAFTRYLHYPNMRVYPLAVYRRIGAVGGRSSA